MNQFDMDSEELAVEKMVAEFERMREEEVKRNRQIAYAEYDHVKHRWRRLWQRLTFQKVMSREKWKSFVDRVVK